LNQECSAVPPFDGQIVRMRGALIRALPEQEDYDNEQLVGVFVVEGNRAAWKSIEILYDNGESYVVKLNKESTDNLWPGDEIIVGARNLFNGKVVR